MKLFALTVFAVAAVSAAPTLAQNTVTSWSNGNYDVSGSSPGEDPSCIMTSTFTIAGRSDVKFNLLWDGEKALFALTSYDWSAESNKEYDGFAYYFPQSEALFEGGVTSGYVEGYINKGFLTAFNEDFLDRLAADNRLAVTRTPEGGELSIVADLSLTGTATAVAALRRCFTHVGNREAARIRRESRSDYIERDPFAN